MTSHYNLGNGDFIIKQDEITEFWGIWNNAANTWHKVSGFEYITVWPSKEKLVSFLSQKSLFVGDANVIINPYGKLARDLLDLHQKKETSYNERLVIGLVLDCISDIVAYGVHKTGRLTSNIL